MSLSSFFIYIYEVYVKRFWIYIAFLPNVFSFISTYIDANYSFSIPIQLSIFIFIFFAFFSNFDAWNKLYNPTSRPKVILDYDFSTFNLCYLIIKNIGQDTACNIQVKFSPNIKLKEQDSKTINDYPFLKHIDLLTVENNVRFLFTSMCPQKIGLPESHIDTDAHKKFVVQIRYTDSRGIRKYNETQIIDVRTYYETSPKEEELSKVTSELKSISESIEKVIVRKQ